MEQSALTRSTPSRLGAEPPLRTSTTNDRAGILRHLTQPGLLGRLSRGNPKLAPWVLIGVHLIPVAIVALIWWIGLSPVFDGIHWVPAIAATIVAIAVPIPMMYAFGFWGAASGQDGGDQFDEDFTPLVAFGLGWLRWLLQIILIGGVMMGTILIWMDFRPWYISSSPEIDALPDDIATMPIPDDWEGIGEPSADWKKDHMAYTKPHAQFRASFYTPVTYDEMTDWVKNTSAWENSGFGAIDQIDCDASLEWCDAERVPEPGEPREYSLTISWHEARGVTDEAGNALHSVDVELKYAEDGQSWQ
ncbi:hypothetical protein WBG06_09605 [Nocardioides sp. CCNWLW239]|uniref:hypothetical protein n=1 Tax=Nocardioides sp. CCNWLW239 TaxID=3128902 RepID=UPI0030193C41